MLWKIRINLGFVGNAIHGYNRDHENINKFMKQLSLKDKYQKEVVPKMREFFGFRNSLMVPRIEKVVVNVGVGRLSQQANFSDKILPEAMNTLSIITGQKPQKAAAKKSIASFKIREGQTIGLKVTLRGARMYDFLDRLVKVIFPRVRDFRGIDLKNIDQGGNLSVGLKEHLVFPEISPETSRVDFGLQIVIVSSAKKREEAIELYRLLGIPLKKQLKMKNEKIKVTI